MQQRFFVDRIPEWFVPAEYWDHRRAALVSGVHTRTTARLDVPVSGLCSARSSRGAHSAAVEVGLLFGVLYFAMCLGALASGAVADGIGRIPALACVHCILVRAAPATELLDFRALWKTGENVCLCT